MQALSQPPLHLTALNGHTVPPESKRLAVYAALDLRKVWRLRTEGWPIAPQSAR